MPVKQKGGVKISPLVILHSDSVPKRSSIKREKIFSAVCDDEYLLGLTFRKMCTIVT